MTFPLDLFITPTMDPTKFQGQGPRILADWGDQLQRDRLARAELAQRQSQFEAKNALEAKEVAGKNKYYEDLIDARRENSAAMRDEKKEKRVSVLMDAFRRAKTPRDRDLIRQELTRLGYAVEEDDTEMPDTTTAQAPLLSPLDAAPSPAPGKPGAPVPKVDPKFKAALGAEMAKDDDPFGLNEQPSQGDPTPLDPLLFGAGAPAPQQPKRGGRFTVRDDKGNLAMTFDEPVERQKSRMAVSSVLTPLIGQASNPEEKAAAQVATDAAANAVDAGFSMQDAAKFGAELYHKEMARYKTERRPGAVGAGGGSGGISKEDRMRLGGVGGDLEKVIDQVSRDGAMPSLTKAEADVKRGISMLEGGRTGFRDTQAMGMLLREMSGLTVSDREYERVVGGGSKLSELERKVNSYVGGGQLPDDIVRELQEVFMRARKIQTDRREAMANQAEDQVRGRLLTAKPEEVDRLAETARRYYLGGPSEKKSGPAGGGGDEAKRRKALEDKLKGMGL